MAVNPSHYIWTQTISANQQQSFVLRQQRDNDMVVRMARAFGGTSQGRYYAPRSESGPWETTFFYNLDGFTHNYVDQDPEKDFDRVVMKSGNVIFAWNFQYGYELQIPKFIVDRVYWYLSPARVFGFEYLGNHQYNYNTTTGYLETIEWFLTADPNPAPTIEPV